MRLDIRHRTAWSCLLTISAVAFSIRAAYAQRAPVHDFDQTWFQRSSSPGVESPGEPPMLRFGKHVYFPATNAFAREWFRLTTSPNSLWNISRQSKLYIDEMPATLGFLSETEILLVAKRGSRSVALFTTTGDHTTSRLVTELFVTNDPIRVRHAARLTSGATKRILFTIAVGEADELWISDGTAGGTNRIATTKLPRTGKPHFSESQQLLYFPVENPNLDVQPWVSDGTAAGTLLLRSIGSPHVRAHAAGFADFGKYVCFGATTANEGYEWWISDGTTTGTRLIADIMPGANSGRIDGDAVVLAGSLFFVYRTSRGMELWRTDGTTSGTVHVASTPAGFDAKPLAVIDGKLWLTANSGTQLFVSDGTTAGTQLAHGSLPTITSPFYAGTKAPSVDFVVTDASGAALWTSDGSTAGTRELTKLPDGCMTPAGPIIAALDRGRYVLRGRTSMGDLELFTSDGTASGTTLLHDIYVGGPENPGSKFATAVDLEGQTIFGVLEPAAQRGIWQEGASPLSRITTVMPTSPLRRLRREVFFGAGIDDLWVTDGTRASASFVASDNGILDRVMDTLVYPQMVARGSRGFETMVFVTNGKGPYPDTKRVFSSLTAAPPSDLPRGFTALPRSDDFVFAWDGGLYRANPSTALTTKFFSGSLPQSESSHVFARTPYGLLFAATDATAGTELWITDGSSTGTRRLADLRPGSDSSSPQGFCDIGPFVLFSAEDDKGRELWRSDGTAAGTWRITDEMPGSMSSNPTSIVRTSYGMALFAARDPLLGREVFETDGTQAGTKIFLDIHPARGSDPDQLSVVHDQLYVVADDGIIGRELHRFDLGAISQKQYASCIGAGEIVLDAQAPRLGKVQSAYTEAFTSGTAMGLVLGWPGRIDLIGAPCILGWDPRAPIWIVDSWLSAARTHESKIAVPADTGLLSWRFHLQTLAVAPSLPLGLDVSNVVSCIVGK